LQETGERQAAIDVLRRALREHPDNADLAAALKQLAP
jgi:hypothetical protein